MVKTYLRYTLADVLGQVTGKVKPVVHHSQKIFFTVMNDYIIVFNAKSFKALQYIKSPFVKKSEITFIKCTKKFLFVGYSNGAILEYSVLEDNITKAYKANTSENMDLLKYETKFSINKSEITYLDYSEEENQLLSASKDCSIFLIDILSENVLYKYIGHKDSIIKASFTSLADMKLIVSLSKDNTVKIWNKSTQECLQTISNLVNKINYFSLLKDTLILGTYDNKLSIYKLLLTTKKKDDDLNLLQLAHLKGTLSRKSGAKIIHMCLLGNERILAVFSKDNCIEFFKVLSEKEIENRLLINEVKKTLSIKSKEEKEEKDGKEVDEYKEKAKKIYVNEDYNFGLKFLSLFSFIEENEIINVFYLDSLIYKNKESSYTTNIKLCFSSTKNIIELYELSANCIQENLFKLSKLKALIAKKDDSTNTLNEKQISKIFNDLLNPSITEDSLTLNHLYSINNGHKEIVRWVKFSSSNKKYLTASTDCVRIWNYSNKLEKKTQGYINFDEETIQTILPQSPVKTVIIENESPLTGLFLKGDDYLAIATKQGNIHLIETESCEIIKSIKAHSGEIWNIISLKVNKEFFVVSCSSDKKINYFKLNFEKLESEDNMNLYSLYGNMKVDEGENGNEIIEHVNSLETHDQITFMQITQNKKYLVYSLLDNTVRVVYSDSGKEFLNLHGHKLPVLCFDCSSDSSLLVSGSSDKNIKVWGLDFGNTHKSIFAHYDAVTTIKFVNKTHYFFSASKDGFIKYWDGDSVSNKFYILFFISKFELIAEYKDFFGEIWSLDVNLQGTTLLVGSSDKSIKVYELTKEQIVLETENEKKLDEQIEDELTKDLLGNNTIMNPLNKEVGNVVIIKKNLENLTLSEDLQEAINLCDGFKEEALQFQIAIEEYNTNVSLLKSKNKDANIKYYNLEKPEAPIPPILLLGKNIFEYIQNKLKSITPLSEFREYSK